MASRVLPAPTSATLREAALAHLARYGTTRAGLTRVLDRRVERWVRAQSEPSESAAQAARAAVREVVAALAASGLVDDAAFAETRARRLARGKSRVAVAALLVARGVAPAIADAALPADPERELAAALTVARRRRIGPFRETAADPEARRRELATLARAGFPQQLARHALDMDAAAAEALMLRMRNT